MGHDAVYEPKFTNPVCNLSQSLLMDMHEVQDDTMCACNVCHHTRRAADLLEAGMEHSQTLSHAQAKTDVEREDLHVALLYELTCSHSWPQQSATCPLTGMHA